ncbi:hypothetical protein [Maritimibacter dapengensis]|uniref:Type IV pilus biogenesis protein PilP n=1 Tax=Maritimibacter dapengensis TaxID=2836868 RepID=A0ABS6T1A7_9RHOB|nr:hypothetical protein [Maritimibacter dapengensis]MBV7378341.1 hypothetical protein [Maritimibacter dapengensis]
MKPDFALDLSHDGISVLFRKKGGWVRLGEVALDDPKMSDHLAELRDRADSLADGQLTTKLVIPDSQILYTTVKAPGPDDVAREVQIRVALEGLTPYPVSELVFDWRADGETARVAVLARETMEEAEGFAKQFGFNPVSFVARPEKGAFSGEPFFGKTDAASEILSPTERVVPDTSPVPKNPRDLETDESTAPAEQPEPIEEPQAPAATENPDPTEPADIDPFPDLGKELTPEPQPEEPEPAASTLQGTLPTEPETADSDVERPETGQKDQKAPEKLVFQPRETAQPEPKNTSSQADGPGRKGAGKRSTAGSRKSGQREVVTTPILAPFPPTPDDATDTKSYRPVQRSDDDNLPPAPAIKASGQGKNQRKQTKPDEAQAQEPSFSTRRDTPGTDEGATTGAKTPEITSDVQGETRTAPSPKVIVDDPPPAPRLVGEAEKQRLAMARALGHAPADAADDASDKAGLGSRLSGRIADVRSGLARRAEAKASAAKDKPGETALIPPQIDDLPGTPDPEPSQISDPEPAETEPPAKRRGFLGRKDRGATVEAKPPGDSEKSPRAKEAEALTVFGARRGQSTAQKRSSVGMGLILTLLLLLLLAGAALWSTFILTDEDAALFNPEPETETAIPAPVEEPEPLAEEAAVEEPAPDVATTPTPSGDRPTPEEAAESYASTGVWVRAPDTPADPDTARGDDIYVASIDPAISSNDALALPDLGPVGGESPIAPPPPPPPGTTFDLNEDGLVIATPEGSVSPVGVLVTQGRPPVTPAPRPEGIVPAPEVQDDAALAPDLAEDPGLTPRTRPGNLNELAERARLGGQTVAELGQVSPRARPSDLDIDVAVAEAEAESPAEDGDETETADAADPLEDEVSEPDETAIVAATDLAVNASVRPSTRPGNMAEIVAVAQARTRERPPEPEQSAGDSGQVIEAAAATTQPAIPSSASVARTATMKNALNLRKINLIGVYGSNASRRALVRLSSGRYVKVSIGDNLDGGRVTAISASRLVYQKGGRQMALDVLPLG